MGTTVVKIYNSYKVIKVTGTITAVTGGGGVIDGDKGDILVSGSGATWTIENMSENATVTTGTYLSNANQALFIKARKSTAGTITKGQVVYIVGSTGNHLTVELARANAEATSAYTIGIAATTITGSADGFIMQYGRLTALSTLPTASFADGNAIYLSEVTAGEYRVGPPIAPNHGVLLGFVIRASNGATGELDVRIQNYQELDELSDVNIVSEAANDLLIRNATNTRWENTTSANVKTVLAINNVDNTSDATKNSASVTLTNKRITPRTGTVASSATPTINTNNVDFYSITALAVDITSMTTNLSGTPTDGQELRIAITGTAARLITWGASFEASTVALPTTTVLTNRLDIRFIWNTVTSKWRCIQVA